MTQPRPIPHSIKIEAYFWAGTPLMIAAVLSHFYGQTFTAEQLNDAWLEEAAWNPLLQEDRPLFGFDQDDRASLARRLVAA